MKIIAYYVDGKRYESAPQDGKGNDIWDEIEVRVSKKDLTEQMKRVLISQF